MALADSPQNKAADSRRMMKNPTTKQLQLSISVICKVIGQIPCFHIYEKHVAHRFTTTVPEISIRAVTHNSFLDSALMNLRSFNEFFKPDGRRDDIRSYYYPIQSMPPFLTHSEEQDINKYLAHISAVRSDIVTKPWLIANMTVRGLQHGIQFLSLIEASFPLHTEAASIESREIRDVARLLIVSLAAESLLSAGAKQ